MIEQLRDAHWIGCVSDAVAGENFDPVHDNYAPIFRREFLLEGDNAEKGKLLICGLGYFEACINGVLVTQDKLIPAFTNYDKRVFAYEYDVTPLLTEGINVLAVELGRGFYAINTPNVWEHEKQHWHGEPRLICRLDVQLINGNTLSLVSDESFRCTRGATTRCCLYTGESVDGARLEELNGWRTAGYSDESWQQAVCVDAPRGMLLAPEGPPIREIAAYAPVSIEWVEPGSIQRLKFPRNISGWCRLKARGKPGQEVSIRYGEKLTDGRIDLAQDFVQGELQTDVYRFGPSGIMDFEPKFTYKGFQYIEIIGDIPLLKPEDAQAKHVVSDARPVSQFSSNVPLLGQIMDAVQLTLQNNFHSIPTDTPIFEKNGWTGDIGLMADSALYLLDIAPLFDKWMTDAADCQRQNGQVPQIIPGTVWGYSYAPEWNDALFEIVWQLYRHSGEKAYLRRHYGMLKRLAEYEYRERNDKGMPYSGLSDWLAPGYNGLCPEGAEISSACYVVKSLRTCAAIAAVLGEETDAETLRAQAETLRGQINDAYFNQETGAYILSFPEYRQTPVILALALDIAPEKYRASLFNGLVEDIERRDAHLNTGMLGTKYLLPLLSDNGRHDLAFRLCMQDTYPSWGYWIRNGCTTFLEGWELTVRSHNHFLFGTVADWIIAYLAGYRIKDAEEHLLEICPMPPAGLDDCRWIISSPWGETAVAWTIEKGKFTLTLSLPQGVEADVVMPDRSRIGRVSSGQYQCVYSTDT